jgi:hypothetical protein
MVHFNELRIDQNNKCFIIDVSIKSSALYSNVYLDSISIDTQDTYKDGGPSSSIIYYKNITQEDSEAKHYRLELSVGDFLPSLSNNMFFVYVKAKGIPSINTPCGMDNEYTLGVTFNPCALYNSFMAYIKEINNTCELPKGFINIFLQFKAIELSVNTEHYAQAIEYYNKFIKNLDKVSNGHIKSCNCYE